MKFKKEDLVAMAYGDHEKTKFTIMSNPIVDTSRWSTIYDLVFKFEGNFYQTSYSVGATEYQDESPFDYENDEIECRQVWPHEVVSIKYKYSPQG